MKILLRTISLVAIPLCSSAQVTVSEADIAPRIGDRLEYVLQSFEGPLSESVGDIGMMGGPLVVDVRDFLYLGYFSSTWNESKRIGSRTNQSGQECKFPIPQGIQYTSQRSTRS